MSLDRAAAIAFIEAQTAVAVPPLVPEIRLHLATEITPLWKATETVLQEANVEPPFWAFAWPGGQAVARYVLDRPEIVAGRPVLDFGAGSGLVAIAAALAGAARVVAVEIDPVALAAIELNAALNGVEIETTAADVLAEVGTGGLGDGARVVLAGDMCYERPLAQRLTAWLRRRAGAGALVLLGDPGRSYQPKSGLEALARYKVATSLDLEDRTEREAVVWRVLAEV